MIKHLILTICLLFAEMASSQKKQTDEPEISRNLTIKEAEREEANHACAKNFSFSFSDRLKKYPFNKIGRVQFVSFSGLRDSLDNSTDSIYQLPVSNNVVFYPKLKEVKNINLAQVDKLTDILFNYGYKGKIAIDFNSLCYRPRNAILFLDANNKIFEFIEICFECDRLKYSSEEIEEPEMCDEKVQMLKDLFIYVGITYGVAE